MTRFMPLEQYPDHRLAPVLAERRSRRTFAARSLDARTLGQLLWAAQGTIDNDRRTTPSPHGCYPLVLAAYCTRVEGMAHGLYRYCADPFGLQPLVADAFRVDALAIGEQPWLNEAAALVLMGADTGSMNRHFADQGAERGARFVYLEAGAAMQNVLLQAEALSLAAVGVAGIKEHAPEFQQALGEEVTPLLVLCVGMRDGAAACQGAVRGHASDSSRA
ncbi:SagB-type dehydrogenase family enzyme [Kushneria sinocarnis]|uniref:SagB-type dehydrogenase family enzyme n=1 Tax=Kushneria sinocarnis TaxID=595502 RepID=A0A420WUR1_9GAMM|nr:nitroreductase family protein [Kushneria sinocarnis]RKQ97199.1 SagB-type dehydrogenase family enzyme [Kushneria sinocarnis]